MKRLLFILTLVIAAGAIKAQQPTATNTAHSNNLTIVVNDPVDSNYTYFKQESFNWVVKGLKSKTEADNFVSQLKQNTNIKTASVTGPKKGDYNLSVAVNKTYGVEFFERLMFNCGVKYAIINGKQVTLMEGKVNTR